ncbi:hypothetical protein [Paenibacillus cymbidii]|uniref:hypothetical protein n=1 Tax=Paenibacillus cymbidii TaxID=1639034 RepID=UPI001081E600|nr:hypothetical protein [Paenibacillus cymbidii]
MNRITGVVRMYYRDKFSWFMLPWIILLSSFVVNLATAYFVEEEIYTGGIMSIFIYFFVAGIIGLAQMFPFALGMSVRRKDFMLGTAGAVLVNSVIVAVVLYMLAAIERGLSGGWNLGLHFFSLPYWSDGSAAQQLWVNFTVIFWMYVCGFFISSIFRRFGRGGMFAAAIAFSLIGMIGSYVVTYNNWWGAIFDWFAGSTMIELALWIDAVIVVQAAAAYAMLRRATV